MNVHGVVHVLVLPAASTARARQCQLPDEMLDTRVPLEPLVTTLEKPVADTTAQLLVGHTWNSMRPLEVVST